MIVLPAVLIEIPVAPTRLEVGGAENTIWLPFVPDSVKLTPENPSVDPEAVVLPAVFAPNRFTLLLSAAPAATVAVIVDPFRPNETPLLFEKMIWSLMFWLVVPAEKFSACWAVMVDAFRPKLTRFELENTNCDSVVDVVPADTTRLPWVLATVTVAVMVEPLIPNETLFELLNVMAERLLEVVPALMLMLVRLVAIDAVTVLTFSPNVTPLELENTAWPRAMLVVPAEIDPAATPAPTLAVRVDPFNPKLMPLALEKVTAVRLLLVVPAEMLTAEMWPTVEGTV